MEVRAELNYLHIAPRKVRLLARLIKGMDTGRAELELRNLSKRAAGPLLKLLKSAIANAANNFHLEEKGLYIKDVIVNPGPVAKRQMPRALGRAAPIRKRTSHVLLVLDTRVAVAPIKRRIKKEGPEVREATREDLKEGASPKSKEFKREEKKTYTKTTDFVRRVFRRKAI
ncbi:MAG: 50S ribosomal protein L22 [Candidatus Sungiibacteriota bacterium]|uniref:Large ribosomal subunit protein uL22 n=1 Tax=Candidatus Sungiibacteriota bacterium TaxID=2750080 RepID=A0A7T5RJ37_9BACT|nr:MAG: 50S ribosomal protein L22 [Candidatus Sungbacteria bacterium]